MKQLLGTQAELVEQLLIQKALTAKAEGACGKLTGNLKTTTDKAQRHIRTLTANLKSVQQQLEQTFLAGFEQALNEPVSPSAPAPPAEPAEEPPLPPPAAEPEPAAPLPPPAATFSVGDKVRVHSLTAPRGILGLEAEVKGVHGDRLTVWCVTKDDKFKTWSCNSNEVVSVRPDWVNMQGKDMKVPQHLRPGHAKELLSRSTPGWDLAGNPQLLSDLDMHQMDLGLWELIWRLLPGKATLCPSQLTGLVATMGPAQELPEEERASLLQWLSPFYRSDMVIVPVLAGGHWTLLVCLRKERSHLPVLTLGSSSSTSSSQGLELPGAQTALGCAKCEGSGCLLCCPEKSAAYQKKLSKEDFCLAPETWPQLPGTVNWEVKYYDSCPAPHSACAAAAGRLLAHLSAAGVPPELPDRQVWWKQADMHTCGLYCLQAAEEGLREFRGEGPCLLWPDAAKRKGKLLNWLKAVSAKVVRVACQLPSQLLLIICYLLLISWLIIVEYVLIIAE